MASRGQSRSVTCVAWDTAAGAGKTGDAANHTLRWIKDGTAAAPTGSPVEVDSANAPGVYKLALTAGDNLTNGLIDAVIDEPVGGAHRDPPATAKAVEAWIVDRIRELKRSKPETLVQRRYEKLRKTGAVAWKTPPSEEPITH